MYMTSLLGFTLGIKLQGTSVENSMKKRAKRAGDFFGQPKNTLGTTSCALKGQVSRKISVEL